MNAEPTARHAGNTPYRTLDAWRGVAALWVVLLHVRLPNTPGPLAAVSAGGHLGVPIFFVISGYCIANAAMRSLASPRPVAHFLRARVRRIYPPYLLAALAAGLLSAALSLLIRRHVLQSSQLAGLDLFHQGPRFFLATLTLTQIPLHTDLIIPVLWSLCYEIVFYAIVAALLVAAVRTKYAPRLLDALGGLTALSLLWLLLSGRSCPFPLDLWPQFGLGVLVYQTLGQPGRRTPKLAFALCAALALAYAFQQRGAVWADGLTVGGEALFTLAFASALLLLFRWDGRLARLRPVRLLAGVGLFSYSLYLIHLLALGIVTQGLNRLHSLEAHTWLLYFVRLAACVAVGRLFFHVCERPFLDTRQKQARQEARQASPADTKAV